MQIVRDIKWPRQNTADYKKYSGQMIVSLFTICAPIGYQSSLAKQASRMGAERMKLDQSAFSESFSDIWVKGSQYFLMYLPVFIIALTPVIMAVLGADMENLFLKLLFKLINFLVTVVGLIWVPLVCLREITMQETENRYDYSAIFKLFTKNIKTVLMLTLLNVGYTAVSLIVSFVLFGIWGLLLFFGLLLLKAVPVVAMCILLASIPLFFIALYYALVLSGYLQIAFACAVGFHVYENGLGDGFVKTDLGYDYSSGSRMEAGAFGVPDQVGAADNQYNANNFAPAANPAPVASFTPVGVGIAENPNENIEINIGDGTDRYY